MPAPDPNFFKAHGGAPAQGQAGPASKRVAEPVPAKRTGRLPTNTLQMSAPSSISEALADVSQTRPEAKAGAATAADGAVKSTRQRRSSKPPAGNGSRAVMLDDIDESFDKIITAPKDGEATRATPGDIAQVQSLFKEMAASYLGPVRDLMIELELGEPAKDWLSVCGPSVASLKRSAESMGLGDLAAALAGLAEAMERAGNEDGALIGADARELLKKAYRTLVLILPDAFAVEHERDRREPTIVLALLRQLPEVRKVALDKLYAAGLTSLDMFYKATPGDIAAAAGLPLETCERVVERFQRYRRETGSVPPGPGRSAERATLERLVRQLEQQNKAFEDSAKSWKNSADKRQARKEREQTLVDIQLLLARLGEVDLVERLERAAFQRKAEELRRYLSDQNGPARGKP